jgi:hypothetical protein
MRKTNNQGLVKPFIVRPLLLHMLMLAEGPTVNRMLMELEIECASNGGKNNGKIIHTYSDFVRNGTSRKHIKSSIRRLEQIGVVRKKSGRPGINGYERPNLFELTHLPTWNGKRWMPATNTWLQSVPKRVVLGKNPVVVKRELRHVVPPGEPLDQTEPAQNKSARNADKIRKTVVVKRELLSRCKLTKPPIQEQDDVGQALPSMLVGPMPSDASAHPEQAGNDKSVLPDPWADLGIPDYLQRNQSM